MNSVVFLQCINQERGKQEHYPMEHQARHAIGDRYVNYTYPNRTYPPSPILDMENVFLHENSMIRTSIHMKDIQKVLPVIKYDERYSKYSLHKLCQLKQTDKVIPVSWPPSSIPGVIKDKASSIVTPFYHQRP
jgi:hypothetical protein